MATNYNRRRGMTTNRTGYSASSRRSTGRRTFGNPGYNTFGTTFSLWNRTNSNRTIKTSGSQSYRTICSTFEQKINSFKALCAQTTGPAINRPSPTTLNSFANLVNKGAVIQRVAPTQISRWSGKNRPVSSPTMAKAVLCHKFGKSAIKAVACDKRGGFIVATNPTRKGKSFKFPTW